MITDWGVMDMFAKAIACSLCMIMFSASFTLAQQAADEHSTVETADQAGSEIVISNPSYDALPLETQQKIITEAQDVRNQCTRNSTYSSFINCHCLAEKFADTRIDHRLMPEEEQEELGVNKRNIMHIAEKRQTECLNKPGIVKYAWNQCQSMLSIMPEVEGEEFCNCYANAYTENFSENPKLIRPILQQAGTRAIASCRDG